MRKVLIPLLVVLFIMPMAVAKTKLVQAVIEPAAASGGDIVKVTVEFSGKASSIGKVLMIPREFAYEIDEPFHLQKDATGKNIWTLEGPVPYEAPAGALNMEIKAFDEKGKEIVVEEYKEQMHGKAGLIAFEIKY